MLTENLHSEHFEHSEHSERSEHCFTRVASVLLVFNQCFKNVLQVFQSCIKSVCKKLEVKRLKQAGAGVVPSSGLARSCS